MTLMRVVSTLRSGAPGDLRHRGHWGDGTGLCRLITTLQRQPAYRHIAPPALRNPRRPLDGASDREERSTNTDRILTRGLKVAGIGALVVATLAVLGIGVLWRPGRSG